MKVFEGSNFAQIYKEILNNTLYAPDYIVAPRGEKTHELFNVALELSNPKQNFFWNSVQAPSSKYLAGEMIWYFSGDNSLEFIRRYSKFWEKIACPNGTCNSAYGYLLFNERNKHGFTEWEWALRSLQNEEHSRQAIIRFNKSRFSYLGNKDFVCTFNGHFVIRNNKLYLTVFMRANDLRRGTQYDVPFFTTLQSVMHKQLLCKYPLLELGTYTHFVSSIHLYESDFEKTKQALKSEYISQSIPSPTNLIPISDKGTPIEEYINLAKGEVNKKIDDQLYCWITKMSTN